MYIKRALESKVIEASKQFSVVMLTGPRQVGKTTLLKELSDSSRRYVTLDDVQARDLAKSDPELFLQQYKAPVLIDEIQYAPELLPYIKIRVDQGAPAGSFWITGSQVFHLMKNVSESLAGRVAILPMQGLSNAEVNDYKSVPFTTDPNKLKTKNHPSQDLTSVFERIHKGSMPSIYGKNQDWSTTYGSFVDTYLRRDVRDLTQVADELSFSRFMTACAARTGQMLNYADLAKDVDISAPTAKKWMSILITSGIVTLIEPYFNNALKRIIKAPNMYFMDTGLVSYLLRWDNGETLSRSAMAGSIFETYVVSEILKSYLNDGKRPSVYYYRDNNDKEIDLILYYNDTLFPIEIKKSANPGAKAIKNFSVLDATGKKRGVGNVICLTPELMPIDRNNWCVPVSYI